jgi:hypothetical protein
VSVLDPHARLVRRDVAVVRPYDDRFKVHVLRFIDSMGFETEGLRVLPPGRGDEEAASWVAGLEPPPGLLLMPFHEHSSDDGEPVDGLKVAQLLDKSFVRWRVPIFMPVTDFAWAAKFRRRFDELSRARPDIAELTFALPASRIPDARVAELVVSFATRRLRAG